MNHKRGRPKNRRAGCLSCKYWKVNGAKQANPRPQEMRARADEREQRREL